MLNHEPLIAREPFYDKFKSRKKNHKKVWSNDLNRAFSKEELNHLLSFVRDERHLICFQLQAYLGLAVNEAVRVNTQDVDFDNGRVYIFRKKTKNIEFAVLHPTIERLLREYLNDHRKQIEASGGYLVYNTKGKSHLSPESMRSLFDEYRKAAGLDKIYMTIKTTGDQRAGDGKARELHVYGTHSLKRFYTTHIYQSCRDPNLTRELSRHKQYSTTQEYIGVSEDQKQNTLLKAFGRSESNNGMTLDDPEFMEFMKIYRVWKKMKA